MKIRHWKNEKLLNEFNALLQEKELAGIRLADQLLLDDLEFELQIRGLIKDE